MESHSQSRNAVSSRENVKTIQTVNHVTCSDTLCCSFSITASEGSGFVCFFFKSILFTFLTMTLNNGTQRSSLLTLESVIVLNVE